MSSQQVLSIIASLNGGFNGDVPGKQINVEILSETEAIYTLVHWDQENDRPGDKSERYQLTLVELPPLPAPPEEALAADAEPSDPVE